MMFQTLVSIASGLMSLITFGAFLIKPIREKMLGTKKAQDGQKCMLRADMLRTYYHNKDRDKIRQYELENFIMEYNAYKALGGNSFIDRIYGEVKTWDVES